MFNLWSKHKEEPLIYVERVYRLKNEDPFCNCYAFTREIKEGYVRYCLGKKPNAFSIFQNESKKVNDFLSIWELVV